MNYTLETPFGNPHGKLSKKNCRIIWAQNDGTGTRFTQVRIAKRRGQPSAAEMAVRAKFRQAMAQVNAIMMDIDQLEPYRSAWRAAIKSGNYKHHTLRGYVFSKVYQTL